MAWKRPHPRRFDSSVATSWIASATAVQRSRRLLDVPDQRNTPAKGAFGRCGSATSRAFLHDPPFDRQHSPPIFELIETRAKTGT